MGGVAASTYYDVVTRYRIRDEATADLNRYTASTHRAEGAVGRLRRGTLNLGGAMRGLALMAGPVAGGMLGFAAVGYTVLKTFRNLNEEVNSTISLASQVNLAAAFSPDPIENFNVSMRTSRDLVKGLTRDAAKLPGELSDFIAIARQISGGVFAGGGDPQRIRDMTARLALAAPAAGATGIEAGRQAMRMLFGTASVGDNPLFAMLQGSQLLPNTQVFNALPAAQRLRQLDDALAKLTDNPMFRKNVLRTWDTQLGTLSDNLLGASGIMGQLLSGPFRHDLLDSLTELNRVLENKTPSIVENLSRIGDVVYAVGVRIAENPLVRAAGWLADTRGKAWQDVTGGRDTGALLTAMFTPGFILRPKRTYEDALAELARPRNLRFQEQMLPYYQALGFGERERKFELKDAPKTKIEQVFNIKVDLKSDDAPDAVALKIEKAMQKVGRHPTTVQWGLGGITGP